VKPERSRNAYSFFCEEQRPAVMASLRRANCGKLPLKDLGRNLGALWKNLARKDRLKYMGMAALDREQLQSEQDFNAEAKDPVRALKAKYKHLIPRPPPSAFWLFSQDAVQREAGRAALVASRREVSLTSLAKVAGEQWRDLSDEVRATFTEQAAAAGAEYAQQLKEWKATPEFAEVEALAKQRRGSKRREAAERKRKVQDDGELLPEEEEEADDGFRLRRITGKRPFTEQEKSARSRMAGA